MGIEHRIAARAAQVHERLAGLLHGTTEAIPERLLAAMRHAVLGGGKRFRPFLVLESAALFGVVEAQAMNVAAAVEFLHCYSLTHDDLPAMDDDAVRRGRPTVHVAFGEATAILAGDALQALAFEVLARAETHPESSVRARLVLGLAEAAGAAGMVGGQQLDLDAERDPRAAADPALVQTIQDRKTGALIAFAARSGAILAGAAPELEQALGDFGRALGAAFQVADDLLDAEGDPSVVGKATAKDAGAGKATYVAALGSAGARAKLRELEAAAEAALAPFGPGADTLRAAIGFVVRRTH